MIVLHILWLPLMAWFLTIGWILLDYWMGWHGPQSTRAGVALVVAGQALCAWCVILLLVRGRGSPHPFVMKTKRLVTTGPYAIIRNPMMWGIGATLIGLCLWLGSVSLWVGVAGFVLFVSLFVPRYEERDMLRRFGDEYREYCRQVPRWFPLQQQRTSAAGAGRR